MLLERARACPAERPCAPLVTPGRTGSGRARRIACSSGPQDGQDELGGLDAHRGEPHSYPELAIA